MYTLLRHTTNNKAAKYHYQVVDADGNVLTERRSNREYVAATINGQYYFGRRDLVGKGDHGRQVRWCQQKGQQPTPVAYLKTEEN